MADLASLAAATLTTPPGGAAIGMASPPAAGSSQRAALSLAASSPAAGAAAGPWRWDMNSSEPSGRNSGLPSPSALRVRRAAGRPVPAGLASIRQMLLTNFLPSASTVCTAAASQLPSGASRSAVSLGMATKSCRSRNSDTDPPEI